MQWVRHPLVHFLLGGAAIFGVYEWSASGARVPEAGGVEPVRIGSGEVAWLQESWVRVWQRPATRDEMIAMVTSHLKEELLAREARAMGLDRDDTLVRRRLSQKLSFLLEDTFRLAEPAEEDLRRYFEANTSRYEVGGRVSFIHAYFNPESRADASGDAQAALAQLSESPEGSWDGIGDRMLIESAIANADRQAVAAQFGNEFAGELFEVLPGEWQGPIQSAYGFHLVRVDQKSDAETPEFDEVAQRVREDWYLERHAEEVERYFEMLMDKYGLVVDDDVRGLIGPLDELVPQSIGGSDETP